MGALEAYGVDVAALLEPCALKYNNNPTPPPAVAPFCISEFGLSSVGTVGGAMSAAGLAGALSATGFMHRGRRGEVALVGNGIDGEACGCEGGG